MTLKEDLGFIDSGTVEWAEKQLKKAEQRLDSAIWRDDPSADRHREIVGHWETIVGVLHGGK